MLDSFLSYLLVGILVIVAIGSVLEPFARLLDSYLSDRAERKRIQSIIADVETSKNGEKPTPFIVRPNNDAD